MTDLDAMARAQGYPDYATMNAFLNRQSAGYRSNNGSVNVSGGQPGGPQAQARPISAPPPPHQNSLAGSWTDIINRLWPQ